jgi:hypothetical protein
VLSELVLSTCRRVPYLPANLLTGACIRQEQSFALTSFRSTSYRSRPANYATAFLSRFIFFTSGSFPIPLTLFSLFLKHSPSDLVLHNTPLTTTIALHRLVLCSCRATQNSFLASDRSLLAPLPFENIILGICEASYNPESFRKPFTECISHELEILAVSCRSDLQT